MGKRKFDSADAAKVCNLQPRRSNRLKSTLAVQSSINNLDDSIIFQQPNAQLDARPGKSQKSQVKPSQDNLGEARPALHAADRQFWLLKAEPETRLENGIDVKFSIDDLASKTDPEPWDGVRNYGARNNLRAMNKGDLAFFYHSNCKEPGIVGTMEIVQEHSPDLSAHDPTAPYYDRSSKSTDPKWSVVHVKFHSKFKEAITLKELRKKGAPGGPLEKMQLLKQSRLSVSRVSVEEWEYLLGVAQAKASA